VLNQYFTNVGCADKAAEAWCIQCLDYDKVPLVLMRHTETFADAPWHSAMPANELSTASRGDLIQFVEQSLGIDEIRRIEAFGKPAVDSLKKLLGFLPPALIFP
jgi:hypothetical protein